MSRITSGDLLKNGWHRVRTSHNQGKWAHGGLRGSFTFHEAAFIEAHGVIPATLVSYHKARQAKAIGDKLGRSK